MRYKVLGRSGLRVSELALGTMTFGEDWGWGASEAESRRIFDTFAEAGGTFIDTANNYTNGSSERIVGDCIAAERERFVVATKFTLTTRRADPNGGGNGRKNIVQSVEASLRRLNTEYIDLYWLHVWDFTTPVEEVMRALDDLVRAGKVLYLGISDSPAWVVSRATTLAELRGWSPFTAIQVAYNVARRDPERDLLPMARALGLGVTAWGVLGGGVLTGKYNQETEEPRRYEGASERARAMAAAVMEIARELGSSPAQVALNWLRQREAGAPLIPIVGARSAAQLRDSLAALERPLAAETLARLDELAQPELGFPHTFFNSEEVLDLIFGDSLPRLDRPPARA